MVVVPADNVVLVRVWFFSNTIVNNHHAIVLLDLPHMRLHNLPQLSRPKLFFRQQPLDLGMAHIASQQPRQASSGGLPEGTDEIITIDV